VRTPDGEIVLHHEGSGFIEERAKLNVPSGDYEQHVSFDGGKTWRNPLYLTYNDGSWIVKGCPRYVGRSRVPCSGVLGHEGPCH
jgi:hypothetical protein